MSKKEKDNRNINFSDVNWDEVLEYDEINIDPTLPVSEKMKELRKLTPYPNCLKINGYKVIMTYNESDKMKTDSVDALLEILSNPKL